MVNAVSGSSGTSISAETSDQYMLCGGESLFPVLSLSLPPSPSLSLSSLL
jgi:hypothetical protein